MTGISLFIPDGALREAVVEQIKAAHWGEPRIVDGIQSWGKQNEDEATQLLIIDDADADKKLMTFLHHLKDRAEKPAILMLGGRDDFEGVSETFEKPLRLGHLLTRIRYYMETAPLLRDRVVDFGPYRLEPQNRRILCANNSDPIRLTEKETALLVFLAQRNEPATRRDILAAIWGYDERIDTHTLETHIYQLRRKLDKDGGGDAWLVNEAGAYRLARGQA